VTGGSTTSSFFSSIGCSTFGSSSLIS
jgi:hypothetical protein